MYIIYLYIIYILFISLVRLFKNSSSTGRSMYVTTLLLLVTCYLLPLIVKIAPAPAASSGANRHVERPYCYLLLVTLNC